MRWLELMYIFGVALHLISIVALTNESTLFSELLILCVIISLSFKAKELSEIDKTSIYNPFLKAVLVRCLILSFPRELVVTYGDTALLYLLYMVIVVGMMYDLYQTIKIIQPFMKRAN
ncbi:MAG: hypothetical protein COA94_04185 [Rickettsiales bacterium]|nr:MAG: hypothetical protein COA94_04185 [Rickettsiales bacterium]